MAWKDFSKWEENEERETNSNSALVKETGKVYSKCFD